MDVPADYLNKKYSNIECAKVNGRWQINIPKEEYSNINEICSDLPEQRQLTFYEAGPTPSKLEIQDATADTFASKITNSRIIAKYVEYILQKKGLNRVTVELGTDYLTATHDMDNALLLQEELIGATLWTIDYNEDEITKVYRFTRETILTPEEYLRSIYLDLSCTECNKFRLSTNSSLECPQYGSIELNPQSVDKLQNNICPNMRIPFSSEPKNVTITSKRFSNSKYADDHS